jgi:hypothetical protein
MEMKREAEEKKLHRMANVRDCLEMWQGSQTLRATQKESRTQNEQMTAVAYISDKEDIVNASYGKDAYASVRLHRDIVANVQSSDYIYRCVHVQVRVSLEI